jgi:hypothetical protein
MASKIFNIHGSVHRNKILIINIKFKLARNNKSLLLKSSTEFIMNKTTVIYVSKSFFQETKLISNENQST